MTDYDDIKALNWSALKNMAVSPLLYKWRRGHPAEEKAAYALGSAIHCAVLEPKEFSSRYLVFTGVRRGSAWDDWQADHPGVVSLKPAESETVVAVVEAVLDHPAATKALRAGGRPEQTVLWHDPVAGLACKARIDFLHTDRVVDLKTARDVSERKFARAVADYLYHGQLAYYHDGAIAAGKIPADALPPQIIAAQTGEPFDVVVYNLTADALKVGRVLYRSLIEKLLYCIEADHWPGLSEAELPLDVPPWAPGNEIESEDWE